MVEHTLTRTRFAPSPTGDLHLGGALCALASFWLARVGGGAFALRVEDLDPPRVVAGSEGRILEDLRWLGLGWDEPPVVQSLRSAQYEAAIAVLRARGLVYPCDCSRAEIARVASAPHAGEELVYPGTCRDADPDRAFKRPPALRVRVPKGQEIEIVDAVAGRYAQRLDSEVGDFVLMRGDGVYAYQLAVVVDDLAMRITDVVRGADLLASTPRQVWLGQELLAGGIEGETTPTRWMHLPLVVDHEGNRLAKRTPGAHVRALRDAGVSAEAIVGQLAHALGLIDAPALLSTRDLVACKGPLAPRTLRVPTAWAQRVASER